MYQEEVRSKDSVDITICMPYFERLERLKKTVTSFISSGYFRGGSHCSVGLSIVDDGSIDEPCAVYLKEIGAYINIRHSALPPKKMWKNPCVPINRAARQTSSPLILLQSPETYHPKPVVEGMANLMTTYKDIILCPTRATNHKGIEWYAHPDIRPVKYWFCQLMSRDFFEEVGGFDESFREGHSYDDDDFADRLSNAGAQWRWFNGEVIHEKAPCKRPRPKSSNRQLYKKKREGK